MLLLCYFLFLSFHSLSLHLLTLLEDVLDCCALPIQRSHPKIVNIILICQSKDFAQDIT
jgi:hypothetical protein